MATISDTTLEFFTKASPAQWSFVFSKYQDALKAKAARRTKKGGPEELMRMDSWYQEEFPKIILARKELFITHEELVQLTRWKLMREKFRPNLIDLVRINTEKAVLTHSKKAFKRMPNLSGAVSMLTCLKGVGPATASAILAAAYPDQAPFMADECMLSTPGVETMDYTVAEYMNFAMQLKKKSDYLNTFDKTQTWTPHKIELALWAHFVAGALDPTILSDLPPAEDLPAPPTTDQVVSQPPKIDEDSRDTVESYTSASNDCEYSEDSKDGRLEPPVKKLRV